MVVLQKLMHPERHERRIQKEPNQHQPRALKQTQNTPGGGEERYYDDRDG